MTHKIGWLNRPGTTGETWNPVTGCTKISSGCKNCYAERMSHRLAGRFGYPADDPFKVTLHPDKLQEPRRWKKPRTVFVCSMGDLFHEDVKPHWIAMIWLEMQKAAQHTFIVLTKRPDRMRQILSCYHDEHGIPLVLPNVWGLVTAENQKQADLRIPLLLQCQLAVRGVSIEPMLEMVHLMPSWLIDGFGSYPNALDWVIVGGETGPGARHMSPNWAMNVRDRCRATLTPYFFKQMSNKAPIPADLLVREWPGGSE